MKLVNALVGTVGINTVAPDVLQKALFDAGFTDTAADYNPVTDQVQIDLAAVYVLIKLKILDSTSQGDFSIKLNHEQADKTITFLYNKNGGFPGTNVGDTLAEAAPAITDKSYIW